MLPLILFRYTYIRINTIELNECVCIYIYTYISLLILFTVSLLGTIDTHTQFSIRFLFLFSHLLFVPLLFTLLFSFLFMDFSIFDTLWLPFRCMLLSSIYFTHIFRFFYLRRTIRTIWLVIIIITWLLEKFFFLFTCFTLTLS